MVSFDYTISNPLGINARPASVLAKIAEDRAGSRITITKDYVTVRATQLMMLLTLGVRKGDRITVAADGGDEEESLAAMKGFFRENL